jgi:acetyl-CoA synthase
MGGVTLEDVVILSAHGAKKIVSEAEELLKKAISENGENQKISFPDTAYYLPLSYALFGFEIKTLKDIYLSLNTAISIINKKQSEPLKYVLDNGVATLLAEEIITAIRYLYNQEPQPDCEGFFSDTILRTLGIQLVDGRLSGFAAILGAAPDNNTAVEIVRELQKRQILVFLGSSVNGKSIIDQLKQENLEMGWETYVVPYGRDTISLIYPLNWAIRAALTFGGIKPGDTEQIIKYCKERIFAFAIALGALDEEKVATGAGAINVGIPIIADTDIPEIPQVLVKQLDHKKIVQTAVDVRGLKVRVREVDIPVPFSSAFEGERVRKEQTFVEFGSKYSKSFELLIKKNLDEVEDGKIELIGPDIDQMGYTLDSPELPFAMPLGIIVEVAGKKMQKDYESIIERQIHHYLNYAMGIFHMGQRDQNWIRISKQAFKSGFRLKHLGKILHFGLHEHFPALIDKLQIKIITDEPKVVKFLEEARKIYEERDERIAGLTDEAVDTFYSCTLCQSYAPNHVCVITPEKLGLCGAYNWFDGKVAYEINPKGMNQPIPKGRCIDPIKGEWEGVNEFVYKYSNRAVERFFNYSIMEYPTTSCGCFECIIAIIPECNGFMVVNRGYTGMTPVGMTFSTLAGSVGGGNQTPGFLGVGRLYLLSKKFLVPEGGLRRIVWMTKELKEFLGDKLKKRCEEIGEPDLVDKIADETITTDSVQLLEYLTKVNHPALSLPPLI